MKIIIINGPNLNLLGMREPGIYGSESFDDCLSRLRADFADIDIDYFQSNSEGALIDRLHHAFLHEREEVKGIVLNAGAYTHTSVALRDAIAAISIPVIEVHISNVHKREEFRHHSFISPVAAGIIIGCGLKGYELAVRALL